MDFDDGTHTTITVQPENIIDAEIITGKISGPVKFEGVGLSVDSANELVFPIMYGSPSSYSWYPEEPISEYPMALGNDLHLVAALQVISPIFLWLKLRVPLNYTHVSNFERAFFCIFTNKVWNYKIKTSSDKISH